MEIVLLIAAVVLFALAFVSIRYPQHIRTWMRRNSPGIAPNSVRELAEAVAPTIFAIFGIGLGAGLLVGFVSSVVAK